MVGHSINTFAESNGELNMKVSIELSVNWQSRCAGVVPHSRVLWQAIKRDVLVCVFMRNTNFVDNDILLIYLVSQNWKVVTSKMK
jgi:hypothetical protein